MIQSEVASSRAQVIEVAVESTFQPLLQLYLLLPILVQGMQTLGSDLLEFDLKLMKRIQFYSIITSTISLAWSFAFYEATVKREALDFCVNFFGRTVMIVSKLFMISARLIALVIFAYCFGPGQFLPLMAGLLYHIVLCSILHYATSSFPKKREVSWKILIHCLLNGLANIHHHHSIIMPSYERNHVDTGDTNRYKKEQKYQTKINLFRSCSTLFQQTVFDTILFSQNFLIMVLAKHFLDPYFQELIELDLLTLIVMSFTIAGLVLKCFYYKYLHTWSSLNGRNENQEVPYQLCCKEGFIKIPCV